MRPPTQKHNGAATTTATPPEWEWHHSARGRALPARPPPIHSPLAATRGAAAPGPVDENAPWSTPPCLRGGRSSNESGLVWMSRRGIGRGQCSGVVASGLGGARWRVPSLDRFSYHLQRIYSSLGSGCSKKQQTNLREILHSKVKLVFVQSPSNVL
jgi:hypothetical protein